MSRQWSLALNHLKARSIHQAVDEIADSPRDCRKVPIPKRKKITTLPACKRPQVFDADWRALDDEEQGR
jgi:hypothetical protein